MRYDDDGITFDTGNRAWTRFGTLLAAHFTVLTWTRLDGRLVLATVHDPDSGDSFTIAVIDSLEIRDPDALVTITKYGAVALHGPFDGPRTAHDHAAHLALNDDTLAAIRGIGLHSPDRAAIPADDWVDIPPRYADGAVPHPGPASTTALVLLDRARRLVAAGPFPSRAAAAAWQPDPAPHPGVARLLVPLHPAASAGPALRPNMHRTATQPQERP